MALALMGGVAAAGGLDEFKAKRQPVFQFAQKPHVARDGDRVTIAFASKGYCDATVASEDAEDRIVRHLACGVLGPNPPPPFQCTMLTSGTNAWNLQTCKPASKTFESVVAAGGNAHYGMYGGAASAMAARAGRIALAHVALNRLRTDGSTAGLPLGGPQVALTAAGGDRYTGTASPKSAALSTDQHAYAPGERVQIRLRVLDPALMAQLEGQTLYASVATPDKDVPMVPLRPDPGGEMLYLGTYEARRIGSMLARANQAAPGASSEAKPLFDVEHAFLVRMQCLEAKDTSADLDAMKNLAARTDGTYFDYRNMAELDALPEAIPPDPQVLRAEILLEVWDGTGFCSCSLP